MKNCVLTVFALLFCLTQLAAAKEPRRVISITPISMSLGGIYVNYEEIMSSGSSISPAAGTVSFTVKDEVKKTSTAISLVNFGFGYYFYPKKTAPRGFYWGPKVECNMINLKYTYEFVTKDPLYGHDIVMQDEARATVTDFEIKVQTAYRWIWKSGLTLELGTNLGYASADIGLNTSYAGRQSILSSGFYWQPFINSIINVGYAF